MNYYPFHIGDYLSATRHLSWEEDAAYRRLLDTYYTTEKALPLDIRAIFRLVVASTDSQREAVSVVLNEFFDKTADGWVCQRAEAEIQTMRDKQQKQRDRANRRWHVQDTEPANATAMPRHETSDATAQKADAHAMPPTPTPTPTPIAIQEKTARKRAAPSRPDEVSEPVWQDFLAMRKAKRAPLNDTALDGIRREAAKAGISLGCAVAACCEFGWQGFNAGWYAERMASKPSGETAYQRSMRERVAEFSPSIARQAPDFSKTFIEEVRDVTVIASH